MAANPLALIAELTYRCPLHCVYCSNPIQATREKSELTTADWQRVFAEAAKMGVLHVHLTGGEPLGRADLEELIAGAASASLYTNLITSGVGLSQARLATLLEAGLDHIQLSFQDSREEAADWIAGARVHARKTELAHMIRKEKIAFTVNLVVHRQNLDHLEEMLQFIEQLEPDRVEIAHTQYYGWALQNRSTLLPTRAQVEASQKTIAAAQQRLAGRVRLDSVTPDYYARFPKACMGGWGRKLMLIDPFGRVLPCHAAGVLPGIEFESVRERSLEWIWQESSAFQKFRGETWMQEPCRSCAKRAEDFGGCRCQAFLLAGDANATDPVCSLAPERHLVNEIVATVNADLSFQQSAFQQSTLPQTSLQPSAFSQTAYSQTLLPQKVGGRNRFWSYRTNPE
ncbi:MAG TPA: pyrroloquinoline quinone biosynthesis protein PqqE [Candidatus Angelobacter sp.]|nr:pyrroloquinoline quinone biosynthesis protein PqqE [Candidatus Angelobacter sp.]